MRRHIDTPGKLLFLGTALAFAALVCLQHGYTPAAQVLAGLAATVHVAGARSTRVFWK